jgi:probable HAF family extracellular repeat protein
VLHNLGTKMSCQGSSHAVGMNDDRLLAGWTSCWGGDAHAFISQGGVVTDLPTLGGIGADARGINNAGQVIGVAATDRNGQFGPYFHGFRWESGAITDLGTLGGDQSNAWAISSNGHVIGSAQDASGAWLPYLHDGGQMRRLPDCRDQYTMPRGINAKDEVIGMFGDGRKKTAFLMRKDRCYPLANLLGDSGTDWEIDGVSAINDAGLIVGHGHYRGEERAFIATPVAP